MRYHVISYVPTHAVEPEVANMVLPAGVEATANFDTKLSDGGVQGRHLSGELALEFSRQTA